jgi:quercetin dioxygenase-like cupin family protein
MVALMSVALATARPAAVAPAFGAAVQTASATSSGVLVWPGADSFKAGSLLLDRMASNHYSIYTVRREARGRVELHERDMDIVLVLEGAATFVTGGTINDRHVSGPGESTGTAIENGAPHRLGKGDVVIVPNGVPHWFSEVTPAIRYFAVKIRQESASPSAAADVRYWSAKEAFAARGPVFDASQGRFARVYALGRSMPLGVELHELDTDLVFVLSGSGTFVTNGSIVEPRPLAANESTGRAITDGTPRLLTSGAVLVVPAGTPHWLRDVDGSLEFFAVKVR